LLRKNLKMPRLNIILLNYHFDSFYLKKIYYKMNLTKTENVLLYTTLKRGNDYGRKNQHFT